MLMLIDECCCLLVVAWCLVLWGSVDVRCLLFVVCGSCVLLCMPCAKIGRGVLCVAWCCCVWFIVCCLMIAAC